MATVLMFAASFIPPPWSYLGPIALGCSVILLLFILANYVYDGE